MAVETPVKDKQTAAGTNPEPVDSAPTDNRPLPIPEIGDVDPDSTRSAEETGQSVPKDRPGGNKGRAWNG